MNANDHERKYKEKNESAELRLKFRDWCHRICLGLSWLSSVDVRSWVGTGKEVRNASA